MPAAAGPQDGQHDFSREHDTPRPVVLAMIVIIFTLVAAGFHAIGRTGIAENVLGVPSETGHMAPIRNLKEILREPVKRNLLGRDVMLWRVPVERVVGDTTFWIGSDAAGSVVVVLLGERTRRQPDHVKTIEPGDVLAVFGTIRSLRELEILDDPRLIEPGEMERLGQEEIYVSALGVELLGTKGSEDRKG